jgi:site-specific recombinase XerD
LKRGRETGRYIIFADHRLDSFDPAKVEQRKKDAARVTIKEAIDRFISYLKQVKKVSENRIRVYHTILGGNGLKRKARSTNKLTDFCTSHNITFISDITADHLRTWIENRQLTPTGTERGDLTQHRDFGNVLKFFRYCIANEWTEMKETKLEAVVERGQVSDGNRTMPFEPEQYNRIVDEVHKLIGQDEENTRLLAITELMRHGGMAIIDATAFRRSSVDSSGMLEYHRIKNRTRKSHKPATVTLPDHVIELLNKLEPNETFSNPEQPFRNQNVELRSTNTGYWRTKLQDVFTKAGITEIQTLVKDQHGEYIMKAPGPHMLRDTFAVEYIKMGALIDQLAVYLGDTEAVVSKHYSHWIEAVKKIRMAENRAMLQKAGLVKK